jgi:hypothetical protein
MFNGKRGLVAAFLAGSVLATAGTATAAKLITGKQIKDGSIAMRDLAPAVKRQIANAGPAGPTGAQGTAGAPGAKGEQGAPGLADVQNLTVLSPTTSENKTLTARCPDGKVALSGFPSIGFAQSSDPAVEMIGWGPTRGPNFVDPGSLAADGWYVEGSESSPTSAQWSLSLVLTCARVAQ